MRHSGLATLVAFISGFLLTPAMALAQTAATGAFTYQGQILNSGQAYSGTADLEFALFDAATGGTQLGTTQTVTGVVAASGVFTVTLNGAGQFGTSPFSGNAAWMAIQVRTPSGSGSYTALSPRVPLTATPYSAGLVFPFLGSGTTASAPLMLVQNNGAGIALSGQSTSGHGVYGRNGAGSGLQPLNSFGTGVWGDTDNGNGVAGTSDSGYGVYGAYSKASGLAPPAGAGVVGDSKSGLGVFGMSNTNSGVYGVRGSFSSVTAPSTSAGVLGESHGFPGVMGLSDSSNGVSAASTSGNGVYGRNGAGSGITPLFGYGSGVWGDTDNGLGLTGTSGTGYGVYGAAGAASGVSPGQSGVVGDCKNGTGVAGLSTFGTGVYGQSSSGVGVYAVSSSTSAVYAVSAGTLSTLNGVYGQGAGPSGMTFNAPTGVWGDSIGSSSGGLGVGVLGTASNGFGVIGQASGNAEVAVYGVAESSTAFAGSFQGNVVVNGTLSKGGGSFKIDHPLDPENKYLYHSFVESPDMKNIYDGVVTTDVKGYATIVMPEWFDALNRDFRYQLTVVDEGDSDEFVQAKVVKAIAGNQFTIRTSRGKTRVSWQLTGIRHDAFANAHRIPVEEYKSDRDRGLYLYPVEQGQARDRGIDWRVLSRFQRAPDVSMRQTGLTDSVRTVSASAAASALPATP